MNKKQLKNLLKEELFGMLNEAVDYNFDLKGKKFKVKFDVNANPTKKGIKIQFYPVEDLAANPQEARQIVNDLQVILNTRLGKLGMSVDFDPDVPYRNAIGFTIKLGTIANVIINSIQKQEEPLNVNNNEEK